MSTQLDVTSHVRSAARRLLTVIIAVPAVLAAVPEPAHAAPPPFSATEMMKLKRLADPQLSPDGSSVVFALTDVDLGANTRNSDLWVVPSTGGAPRRLTSHPKGDSRARFSPDGRRLAFVSAREGTPQAYLLDLSGGEPQRATSLSAGVGAVSWVDAKTLLVTSDVFPSCGADDACNKKKIDEAGKGSSVRAYDHLLYRHWDTWEDQRRTHLLVVPLEGGVIRDLTPGERDVPPFSIGGPDDYAVSPDGREVCFARKDDAVEATSTNADLWVVPVAGGKARRIASAPGYDGGPRYSPDGRSIAYRVQMRAGYESDRWRLALHDRRSGQTRVLTEAFDRHVESFAWSPDSRTIYFAAEDGARRPLYQVAADGGPITALTRDGTFDDLQVSPDGKWLLVSKVSLTHPSEAYRVAVDGSGVTPLTRVNDELLRRFGLRPGESVTYQGAAGKMVQAWIVKPPAFDPRKKYPLLVLIHGGPQGAWADAWSYRWNPQVFASAGYVVLAPNPRGSIGWGQELVDDINDDWGGRCFEDIMKGTDMAEALPYVARGRTVAAGASFGGYMINWIAGHTDRYRALVSHAGLFDLRSMYGATEELWFPEWEFKGPFWQNPESYEKWTPSRHVKAFKTPTLVVHGENDHRVPLEQGLGMFTALQRMGVPSRLLVFPDENHWVLKPANSVRWYEEFITWIDRWSKGRSGGVAAR